MPTNLATITVRTPGFQGLNLQQRGVVSNPTFASVLTNVVFDESNRMKSRNGWSADTETALTGTPDIEQIFEYEESSSTTRIISAATESGSQKIFEGTTTLAEKQGSLSPTNNNWKFQNFNGKCIAWQDGEEPIVKNGSGNFATIQSTMTAWAASTAYVIGDVVRATSGTTEWHFVCTTAGTSAASPEPTWPTTEGTVVTDNTVVWTARKIPQGDECLSAYGRVWAMDDDGTTLKYSALLDETDFCDENGGGKVDMNAVWGKGADFVTALASFQGKLVIFGNHNIAIFSNPSRPNSPDFVVEDLLENMGCIERDTVQSIGSDLLFLDNSGLRSLVRSIELRALPLSDISRNVRDAMMAEVADATAGTIRSTYHRKQGFYLLVIPPFEWYFDIQRRNDDGSARVAKWQSFGMNSVYYTRGDVMHVGLDGVIGTYTGFQDNGSSYVMEYKSPWTDFGEEVASRLKILKRISAVTDGGVSANMTYNWSTDFDEAEGTAMVSLSSATAAEWGVAEWNEDEWSGEITDILETRAPMSRTGQYIRFGFRTTINGNNIAIEQIDVFAKIGRAAR